MNLSASDVVRRGHPTDWVVPIISRDEIGVDRLEGTAFLLCTDVGVRAITAGHVAQNFGRGREWRLAVPTGRDSAPGLGEMTSILVTAVHRHEKVDVGWLIAELPGRARGLAILEPPLLFDWDVLCYEFSPARRQLLPDGNHRFFADAWAHKGNIVRSYLENGIHHLNTSFPTMQGASGSPLLIKIDNQWYAAGMVIGNLEQEFAPSIVAQTVTVIEPDSSSETINYFLPYGVALSGKEVAEAIRKWFAPNIFESNVGKNPA